MIEERFYINLNLIKHCKQNLSKYDFIIVSAISPLKQTRKQAKKIFGICYKEIYIYANNDHVSHHDLTLVGDNVYITYTTTYMNIGQ